MIIVYLKKILNLQVILCGFVTTMFFSFKTYSNNFENYARLFDCQALTGSNNLNLKCLDDHGVAYNLELSGSYKPYEKYLDDGFKLSCRVEYKGENLKKIEAFSRMDQGILNGIYQLIDENNELKFTSHYNNTVSLCSILTKAGNAIPFKTFIDNRAFNSEDIHLSISVGDQNDPRLVNTGNTNTNIQNIFKKVKRGELLTDTDLKIVKNILIECRQQNNMYSLDICALVFLNVKAFGHYFEIQFGDYESEFNALVDISPRNTDHPWTQNVGKQYLDSVWSDFLNDVLSFWNSLDKSQDINNQINQREAEMIGLLYEYKFIGSAYYEVMQTSHKQNINFTTLINYLLNTCAAKGKLNNKICFNALQMGMYLLDNTQDTTRLSHLLETKNILQQYNLTRFKEILQGSFMYMNYYDGMSDQQIREIKLLLNDLRNTRVAKQNKNEIIEIKGLKYQVLEEFQDGATAKRVLHVKSLTDGRDYQVKDYYSYDFAQPQLQDYIFLNHIFPTIYDHEIHEKLSDLEEGILVYKWVDAIDLDKIQRIRHPVIVKRNTELAFWLRIQVDFILESDESKEGIEGPNTFVATGGLNTVLEIETGQFYAIDPN